MYKTLIKELYIKAAMIRTLQDSETLRTVLEDQCKTDRANRLEQDFVRLKNDREYQALPQNTKDRIEALVNLFVGELRQNGELAKPDGVTNPSTRDEFSQLKELNRKAHSMCSKYALLKKGYGEGCFSVLRVRNKDGTITTIVASKKNKN